LHINNRYLSNFGGYPKIRELLGWKNNYVDESGFYNDSFNEMIFANYLIKNNISYSRYEKPYPNEGKFTCDFCFTTKDGIKYYCEIWGYPKNKNEDNMIISDYNKTRKIKESLYKKYNLNLISIEGMIFNYKSSKIQQVLYKILKPYLNYDFIEVDYSCLRPAPKMTDKMLLEEALSYSKDGITLPSPDILNSNGLSGIYNEIRKRYNNYHVFAEKFGFKTTSKNGYWNIDIIFEKFDYMLEKYGKILNTSELAKQVKQDENLKGLNHAISTFGYFRDVLLQYYEYLLNQKRTIPDIEINRLKQIAGIKPDYNKSKEEDKQKALNILSKIKLVS
jgi:hypothetical protein